MSYAVCKSCRCKMRVKKNGIIVQVDHGTVRNGDLWECPKCEIEIIQGFGSPMAIERWQGEIDLKLGE